MRLGAAGLLWVLVVAGTAHAAEPCGGVKLLAGQVRMGRPLAAADLASPEGKACISAVAKEVERNRLVRAVTVASYASDADRASGKGLADAKAVAAALVAAGLPKGRVFAIAPAPRPDEAGLALRYVERAPEDVAARLATVYGAAFLGPDEASLKQAEPGMPVLVNEVVKTGAAGKASIHLKDGSGLELKPDTVVKLTTLTFAPDGRRDVKVEVLRGGVVADVRKATQASKFEASSRVAVASVRGTQFRFGLDDQGGVQLETLEGKVALAPAAEPEAAVEVAAGQGAAIKFDGRVVAPSALPATPRALAPLKGPLGADARLEWTEVPEAAQYRVEVARDADFVVDARTFAFATVGASLPEKLPAGKWFWRVTAVSRDGFSGSSSKVYAFMEK